MNQDERWYHLASKINRKHSCEITRLLEAHNIQSIIIKGPAVARHYPKGTPRPSVDIDVAVAPDRFEEVLQLQSGGAFPAANIDIHKGLKNYSLLSWEEVFSKTIRIEEESGVMRFLSDEDQLRLVALHWLFDGGERRERLADIRFVFEATSERLDWEYLWKSETETRKFWIITALKLAEKYDDLDLAGAPENVTSAEIPRWIIDELEDRWNDPVRFRPIDQEVSDPKRFVSQLRLRFPPNALMAMTALEKDFRKDSVKRAQWSYFCRRMFPSIGRSILNNLPGKKNAARH